MHLRKWYVFSCFIVVGVVLSPHLFAADQGRTASNTYYGRMEVLVSDDLESGSSRTHFAVRIQQQDGTVRLHSPQFDSDPPDVNLFTGDPVAITGRMSGNVIQVQSVERVSPTALGLAETSPEEDDLAPLTTVSRRAVIFILDFNKAQNQYDVDDVAGLMYTDTKNVNGLYRASSFQQLEFDPDTDSDGEYDVFGPFDIDDINATDTCNYHAWADAADQAAADAKIDLSLYQHRVYALPSQTGCSWSGMGSLGCLGGCQAWIRSGGGPVYAHELGHNLDWHHSATDPENDGILNQEYGDQSGIMGWPKWAQANAPHRDQLGWFDAYPGTLVLTSGGGTFEIDALELDPGIDVVGTQVVKIPKDDTKEYYYISYRREISAYPSNSDYADAVNVHRYRGSGREKTAHITNLGKDDAFTDSINGITVTAIAVGGQKATVVVSINGNAVPTADFSYTTNGLQVQFTDASSDGDGSIAAHQWNFGDGATSSQANPVHAYAAAGTYTVQLTAFDDDGASDTISKSVAVAVPNTPPKAAFSFAADHLSVQFTDTSSDSDGTIAGHQWDFGNGTGSDQADPDVTYTAAGTYAVSLTVTDDDGATDTATQDITLSASANAAPQADFEYAAAGLTVAFTEFCTDADGLIQSYQWAFGDGNTSSDQNPEHAYESAGDYTVILTVRDDGGAEASAEKDISVQADPGPDDKKGGGGGSGCFIRGLLENNRGTQE